MRSLLLHDIAKPGHCSQSESLRNSISLWNEQPVLVGRMGPRVRGIHRSGSVSLFRESWRKCVILCWLSLSMWFVCLTPPPHLLLLPLLFHLDCNFFPLHAPQKLFVSVWVRSIYGHVQLSKRQQFLKNEIENKSKTPFFDLLNISTANFMQGSAAEMSSMLWNDGSVVMATLYTHITPCSSTIWGPFFLREVRSYLLNGKDLFCFYNWKWIVTNVELLHAKDQKEITQK